MVQTSNRILKSSDVEIEGRFPLDLGTSVHHAQSGRSAVTGAAKVRIIENQNDFAVIEVTCCCGRNTIVKCEYGASGAVQNAQSRPDSAGAANRTPQKKS